METVDLFVSLKEIGKLHKQSKPPFLDTNRKNAPSVFDFEKNNGKLLKDIDAAFEYMAQQELQTFFNKLNTNNETRLKELNGLKIEFTELVLKGDGFTSFLNNVVSSWIDNRISQVEEIEKRRNVIDHAEPTPEPQKNGTRIIIQWNEQSNVLTDIFRQLKQLTNKNHEPIVGNSNEEIALFLKENFSCFENTKLSTIQTMLKNTEGNANTPKTSRRIVLE